MAHTIIFRIKVIQNIEGSPNFCRTFACKYKQHLELREENQGLPFSNWAIAWQVKSTSGLISKWYAAWNFPISLTHYKGGNEKGQKQYSRLKNTMIKKN